MNEQTKFLFDEFSFDKMMRKRRGINLHLLSI